MEVFDVLDNKGCFTGEVKSREEVHATGVWHRAVVLFIVNSKKQVLMQQRSFSKKLWPGKWDISAGGHVNAGEFGMEAAIREAREEMDITIDPTKVRFISCAISTNIKGEMIDNHFNEYFIGYSDCSAKDIKIQKSEVENFEWWNYEDFKSKVLNRDEILTTKWDAFEALIVFIDKSTNAITKSIK